MSTSETHERYLQEIVGRLVQVRTTAYLWHTSCSKKQDLFVILEQNEVAFVVSFERTDYDESFLFVLTSHGLGWVWMSDMIEI